MPVGAENGQLEKFRRRLASSRTHQHEGWAVGKEKAENGTMSYGLGPGQHQGKGGEYFDTLLVSRVATWRLIGLAVDA